MSAATLGHSHYFAAHVPIRPVARRRPTQRGLCVGISVVSRGFAWRQPHGSALARPAVGSTLVFEVLWGHSHYFAVHTRRGLKEWRGFAWRQPRHTTALARRAAASSDSFVEERPLLAKESEEEAETWPHRT